MKVIYNMNQGYQNNYNKDVWSDVRVPTWNNDFCHKQVSYESCTWPDGETRFYDLVTDTLIVPDKYKVSKNEKTKEQVQTMDAELFNKQVEDAAKKMECDIFMAKLPKFSAGYLAKMNASSFRKERTRADQRFYTWEKGVSASTTSHTAWGHRRNGGGKHKVQSLKEMNCEKAAAQRAAARNTRQKLNKEKAHQDMVKQIETLDRIKVQMLASVEVVNENVELTEEMVKKAEIAARTEEHMKTVRALVSEKLDDRTYLVAESAPSVNVKWSVVKTKVTKLECVALKLAVAFYTDNAKEDFVKSVSKKPMTKAVKRTRFCSSVLKGGKCPHGDRCNFAHTMDQLTARRCAFEKRSGSCKCVRKVGTSFSNKGRKVCEFLHEGETKANMCRRLGVKVGSAEIPVCKPVTKCLPVVKATAMGTKVLKPYSTTMAWGPVV